MNTSFKKKPLGIRSSVIIPSVLVLLITIFAVTLLLIKSTQKLLYEEFSSKGEALAKTLAINAQDSLQIRDISTVQSLLDEFKVIHAVAYVFIESPDGSIPVHSFVPYFPDNIFSSQHHDHKNIYGEVVIDGKRRLDIAIPILLGNMGFVHVGMDLEILYSTIYSQLRMALVISLLGVLLASIILFYILNRPIGQIINLAEVSTKANDDDEILPDQKLFRNDEIGLLAQSISEMIKEVRSKRKKLEEILKTQTEKLIEAQSVAKLGSWHVDLITRKITWTDQLFNMFNLNKSEGEPSFEMQSMMIDPEYREKWRDAVVNCTINGGYFCILIRFEDKNKNKIYCEVQGKGTFDNKGKVIAISGTCQDITEKINKEEELNTERARTIQASKMATLGEMAAGIAHEINNPLTVLAGIAYKFNKLGTDEGIIDKNDLIKYADHIKMMIKRMNDIINGLRTFARDGSDQPKERVQLSKIINDSVVLIKTQFENHQIILDLILDDSIIIECREILISQVLINLINNSFQALKNDPAVYEKKVIIKSYHDEKWVFIAIIDNGPGIPQAYVDKIFQPFFTTKKVGEGTGLGLSISKGIVQSHQGELILEQIPKETKFIIKIPL